MKRNQAARIPAFALLALSGLLAYPLASSAGEDPQIEREQEMARRDMENRERAQAEALRSQEEAIRRMEATQSRIEANTQRMAQESADQARTFAYPNYPYISPSVPASPVAAPMLRDRSGSDTVDGIIFAPLSDRLKSYFGTQSGVLVVSAGVDAPFGLQDGDVIISIDGRVPTSVEHAVVILRSYRSDERVKLRVQRDRRIIDLEAMARGQRRNR